MTISKFQNTESVEINRKELIEAPYNPRTITEKALKSLKRNIKDVGFLGGIVVNKRTMHIVSGHQRLKALDSLEKSDNYFLRVEFIDVDEKTEKEQNIFMNSKTVQGDFNYEMLSEMMPGIDSALAGLDESDVNLMAAYEQDITIDSRGSLMTELDDYEETKKNAKQAVKDAKNAYKEKLQNRDDGVSYVSLSFDSYENKAQFMEMYGFNPSDLFIKGEVLINKINE